MQRRDLKRRLYKWKTSGDCWVLGGWIVLNAWIRELSGVRKGLNERIDEGVLVVQPCGKDGEG